MGIKFGRAICSNLATAETREWLITNGIGSYGAGTIGGLLTRRYHGLLFAALKPPLGIALLLSKLDEIVSYSDRTFPLHTNRWADQTIDPEGYKYIESFYLDGTTPVWHYAFADGLLEKRIWMQQGENTTYIRYTMLRGTQPLKLSVKALVNYRDRHSDTHSNGWQMEVNSRSQGIEVKAYPDAASLFLFAIKGKQKQIEWQGDRLWYKNYALAIEKYRGLGDREDHFLAGTCQVKLTPGKSFTVIASTEAKPNFNSKLAWQARRKYERQLLKVPTLKSKKLPLEIQQLVLAADQFIVERPLSAEPEGKTIIAGYPWFGDWGRDTMISLPGLTLATARPQIGRLILRTFARYVDRGMLPNLFPDGGENPEYNTVDATLWYFEAIRAYYALTKDKELIEELFPVLAEIIVCHRQGTRHNIHLDREDGLIYAGETGVQLTWMDAKVNDWVVTPRIGKPIEVNALWYNALIVTIGFAQLLNRSDREYREMAKKTLEGFQRFWRKDLGYCYDVLDSPVGNDASLRPNQIFAVSLPTIAKIPPLLNPKQQKSVVDLCARELLTSYGLRSLDENHPLYRGHYGGDRRQRDGAYHQGTVWSWLIGHFVQAHLKVYRDPALARSFLKPLLNHLYDGCIGNISEIFDGDLPFQPRGAFAQAWSVAEVLRAWQLSSS